MLFKICQQSKTKIKLSYVRYKQLAATTNAVPLTTIKLNQYEIDWESEMKAIELEEKSVLKKTTNETINSGCMVPPLMPTFNPAAYIYKSTTMHKLLSLGVNVNSFERRPGIPEYLTMLNFETDIKNHLTFLNNIGITPEKFGIFITKNPFIFKEDLDDLKTRINYLHSKNFQNAQISRIVLENPFWLNFKTQRIDKRLGFFQKTFELSGSEIRSLATKQPKIITFNLQSIRKNYFLIKEEMGFKNEEIKLLLLEVPNIWMLENDELLKRIEYFLNTMKISHSQICQSPDVLYSREFKVRERHEFLVSLKRDQYDPCKDLYVSLKALVSATDIEFAIEIAKSALKNYYSFLRTK